MIENYNNSSHICRSAQLSGVHKLINLTEVTLTKNIQVVHTSMHGKNCNLYRDGRSPDKISIWSFLLTLVHRNGLNWREILALIN